MATSHVLNNGNSSAVRIPAELAFPSNQLNLVIERHSGELFLRPATRCMGDVLGKTAYFSPDFMSDGRGQSLEGKWVFLWSSS